MCNLIILLQVTRETLKAFRLVKEHSLKPNSAFGAHFGQETSQVPHPAMYLACDFHVVAQSPAVFS